MYVNNMVCRKGPSEVESWGLKSVLYRWVWKKKNRELIQW